MHLGCPEAGVGQLANKIFDERDFEYAAHEIKEFLGTFDLESFKRKCLDHDVGILYKNSSELESLTDLIVERICSRTPFSLLRAGDGEGNVLSLTLPRSLPECDMKCLNLMFHIMDRQAVSLSDGESISSSMASAFENADVIGTRLFRHGDEKGAFDETSWFLAALSDGEIRGSVGALKAIQFLDSLVSKNKVRGRILTSAWIHLYLIGKLDKLIESAESLVVISGRRELAAIFLNRYKNKIIEFIDIPLQASECKVNDRVKHYPGHYVEVISKLQKNLCGALVLVGAGIFGKIYCDIAKKSGGIAVDMGSAFDLLAGHSTRPIHRGIDVESIKWI